MHWNSIEGYDAVPQILHWITALMILAWLLGQFDDIFPRARRGRRACSYTSPLR